MARGQSLYDWCMENGEWGQQLLYEFGDGNNSQQFYDEETGMYKSPHDFSRGSHTKIKWTCKAEHTFVQAPHLRTGNTREQRRGCPICNGKQLKVEINDLYSWCLRNGEYGKELIEQWSPKNIKKMNDVSYGSHLKAFWVCNKCGDEWEVSINSRTSRQRHCPSCSMKLANYKHSLTTKENSLLNWCNRNQLYGDIIKAEWTGISEDNILYSMDKIRTASTIKLKWICSKKHEWYASVASRTYMLSGCPHCCRRQTSYPEQLIYFSLKQIFSDTITRGYLRGAEFDIKIPSCKLCIEYSPTYWHDEKIGRDTIKAHIAAQEGYRLIYIHEDSYDELEHEFEDNYICYKASRNKNEHNEQLTEIVNYILQSLNHSVSEINIEKAQTEAFNFMHNIEENSNDLSE